MSIWLVHRLMAKLTVVSLLLKLVILLGMTTGAAGLRIEAEISSPDGANTTFLGETGTVLVKGKERSYAEFLGIRYGTPPIGNNRFQRSEMYQYEPETVDATKFGNICYQVRNGNTLISSKDVMDEDCLFLNIYIPLDTNTSSTQVLANVMEKKAVYIFIHGGVFLRGSSNQYRSTVFTTQGDIIVVTINYRLTYLGFLTTDNDVMPANLGLWDQQIAIQWVNDHIQDFGGDQTRVTVGGQSAGSFSSILQSFHEGNRELFRSTIAESGSPLAVNVVTKSGIPTTIALAKTAGCKSLLSKDIRSCLMNMTAEELVSLQIKPTLQQGSMPIGPTFDNDFISPKTFEFLPQGLDYFKPPRSVPSTFTDKNLLIGFTAEDGEVVYALSLYAIASLFPDSASVLNEPLSSPFFPTLVLAMLNAQGIGKAKALEDAIIKQYSPLVDMRDRAAWSRMAVHVLTDYVFTVPSINTATIHANGSGGTFVYDFRLPPNNPLTRTRFSWFQGTPHGADLFMLSDFDVRLSVPGLSDLMITSWSNFIKTGNPNSGNSTEWKEFNENSRDVYELSDKPKVMANGFAREVEFWNQEIPELVRGGHGPTDGANTKNVLDLALVVWMSLLTAWWSCRN